MLSSLVDSALDTSASAFSPQVWVDLVDVDNACLFAVVVVKEMSLSVLVDVFTVER